METTLRAERAGLLSRDADARTVEYLLGQLRSNDAYDAVYLGFGDGSFVDVSRDTTYPGAGYRIKTIRAAAGKRGRTNLSRYIDERGRVVVTERTEGDRYEPRARPWFLAANGTLRTVWTDPYLFVSAHAVGITAAQGRGAGPKRVVAGVDLRLTDLELFTTQLKVSERGGAALIGTGTAVLAGDTGSALRRTRPGESPELPDAADLIPGQGAELNRLVGRARETRQSIATTVGSGDARETVVLTPIDVGQRPWVMLLHGPTSEIIGAEGRQLEQIPFVVALGLLSLVLGAGMVLAVLRPLGGLAATAGHDALTGLTNRLELEHIGESEFRQAQRNRSPLSVLLIDVDDFKQINDLQAHAAGDESLKRVADGLREVVRRGDILARYAGDEFIVLMPGAQRSDATLAAERVVEAVRESTDHRITVSVGIASLGQHSSFGELVNSADRAMYRSKLEGRDRATFADDDSETTAVE